MTKRSLIYLMSIALCGLPACGDDEEIEDVIDVDGNGNGNGDDIDLSDSQILGAVSAANLGEIDQAEVALDRGNADSVVSYAQMMIDDHTTAEQRLQSLAAEQGLSVDDSSVSRMLESQSEGLVMFLESVSDSQFDAEYIGGQVTVHEGLLTLLDTRLIPDASDPLVVEFLNELSDTVEGHLETALDIQDAID